MEKHLQGASDVFLNDGSHKKGKNINQLEVVAMAYLSIDRQDLQIFVKVIQVLIFSIAHYFVLKVFDKGKNMCHKNQP